MHRLSGRRQRVVAVGLGRIVKAEMLQQRDVNGVRVGMKELGAEIDRDPLSPIVDHVRIAVTSDLGSCLEEVDVEGAGQKVGRGDATRTGADDRHPASIRSRGCCNIAAGQHRAGAERRHGDRSLDDIAARD